MAVGRICSEFMKTEKERVGGGDRKEQRGTYEWL